MGTEDYQTHKQAGNRKQVKAVTTKKIRKCVI